VTNLDAHPAEITCDGREPGRLQIIAPRDVPLGGPRAMTVRRTLPSRDRSLIGAWCFLDHYGPDDVSATGGMKVPPHPHTGLQTVSWLFSGEIEHRDSAGNHAMVVPGEVNLMTGGRGISHSEISTDRSASGSLLHGAQLWVALPAQHRDTDPGFVHHVPAPVTGPGWSARVFLGSLLGETSPVPTYTPLLGAELLLEPGTSLTVPVDVSFEHGVLVDTGGIALATDGPTDGPAGDPVATLVGQAQLAYTPPGASTLTLEAGGSWTRLLLLGGPPFGESIVMWWNFVGRTHEEVVAYRDAWQDAITDESGDVVSDSQLVSDSRFGVVVGDHLPPIPAPPLPGVRLRSRQ
jgi:redox-sensitive bicupin YhaK (pirin superfamily)